MSTPKGAAKAAPAKKAASKKAAVVVPAVEVATDWPPGLVESEVESFFRAIESGEKTVKSAATLMAKQGADVYRMARKYPRFAARLEEAVDIGCLMAEDRYFEITAYDKDSAAGANVKFTAIDRYLKVKRPKVYNTSTFKPVGDDNSQAHVVGVVLVPLRCDSAGQLPQQRAAIEGTATQVQRLPIDSTPAPAFKVSADG